MTNGYWNSAGRPARRLYRDRENGLVFGVCAGLADFGGLNVVAVRAVAVICLCLFTWATALVYLAATVLVRERPLIYSGKYGEQEFWRRRSRGDGWTSI